ncbi:ferritin 1 heavy chain isoform X2 [Nomia melanderi]|uniref:ferritin 1 heavy chain isoform X2 n=1 Tax=Nomia melanderi TaxID=2448451 RepID=UPI0013044E53|nr:ferritin subunit-like isoform X2 [Nomia melanderi]
MQCTKFYATMIIILSTHTNAHVSKNWLDMKAKCVKKLEAQVQVEIDASLTYLAMGVYFARDTVNRPGFSKFFLNAAKEEREHAIKIIEYLIMRGQLNEIKVHIKHPKPEKQEWNSGMDALKSALDLEVSVTKDIRSIAKICEETEKFNDYHLVDYLTVDFLDEQYKGQRDLAGKISTLGKMEGHSELGEFLFDKKLLNGEV